MHPHRVHCVFVAHDPSDPTQMPKPHIPKYVHWFVARGSNFAEQAPEPTLHELCSGIRKFHRRATIAAFFDNKTEDKPGNAYRRAKLPSRWQPPADATVDRRFRQVHESFINDADKYTRQKTTHRDWLARQAVSWLRRHPDIVIADTDKNLGDALVHRPLLQRLTLDQLRRGFAQISGTEARSILLDTSSAAEQVVGKHLQAGNLQKQQSDYITAGTRRLRPGNFRIRMKIHKLPIKGRPLCNMSGSTVESLGVFLHETLMPHMRKFPSVLLSTDDLIQDLDKIQVPKGYSLRTTDIKDLFPSINRAEMMPKFQAIFHEILPHGVAKLCTDLTWLVVSGTIIVHGDSIWKATTGVPTGLSASCTLANILLTDMDRYILTRFADQIMLLRRYVDDIFMIDCVDDHVFKKVADLWMSDIEVEHTGKTGDQCTDDVVFSIIN